MGTPINRPLFVFIDCPNKACCRISAKNKQTSVLVYCKSEEPCTTCGHCIQMWDAKHVWINKASSASEMPESPTRWDFKLPHSLAGWRAWPLRDNHKPHSNHNHLETVLNRTLGFNDKYKDISFTTLSFSTQVITLTLHRSYSYWPTRTNPKSFFDAFLNIFRNKTHILQRNWTRIWKQENNQTELRAKRATTILPVLPRDEGASFPSQIPNGTLIDFRSLIHTSVNAA